MKKYSLLILPLLLAACSAPPIAPAKKVETAYNPQTEARIRMYGQHNHSTTLIDDTGKEIKVGGPQGFGKAFSPESKSIGMPESMMIDALAKLRSRLGSQLYFEEFVIPADRQYTLKTYYSDQYSDDNFINDVICKGEADVYLGTGDYEVFTFANNDDACEMGVVEIINGELFRVELRNFR